MPQGEPYGGAAVTGLNKRGGSLNYIKERSTGKGYGVFSPSDSDRVVEEYSITCSHCGHVFFFQRGSGRERGWCHMCGASTCGETLCDPSLYGCAPFEKKLDAYERSAKLFNLGVGPMDGMLKGSLWVATMRNVKLRN